MTETEKHAAYGKAMLDLKEAKFELAAAQQRLTEWVNSAREIISAVDNFSKDPLRRGADQRPAADYSYSWLNELDAMKMPDLVHDVFVIANRIQKLQAQVDAFEK